MKKDFIQTSLKWFIYGVTFSLWVIWVIYASSLLSPAQEWDQLTLTKWNEVVDKINEMTQQIETISEDWNLWWWIKWVSTQQIVTNLQDAIIACANMQTILWDKKIRRLPSFSELEYVRKNKDTLLNGDVNKNSSNRLWTSTPYALLNPSTWYIMRLSDTAWSVNDYSQSNGPTSFRCVY